MLKNYYSLVKPGIIYGNALTVIGGFFLASHGHINFILLCTTLLGISLIIASGCAFNNYIDRDIDALMERTRDRVLVSGAISGRAAILFATCLGIAGTLVLGIFTNWLTLAVGLGGLFAYLVLYSLWSKRNTMHAALIGAISGAVPPVVGYCAVSNSLDIGALMLFLILVIWQLPHALAIAIHRFDDYAAASVPVLPIMRGVFGTKILMTLYVVAFIIATLALTLLGYTGYIYGAVLLATGSAWLFLSFLGFWMPDEKRWARLMFFFSLVVILVFCLMLAVDTVRT